jgi:putative DNA primase/helicase
MKKKVQTYLEVPFDEKEEAKSLGAWWDPGERRWFVPEGLETSDFSKWIECENESTGPTHPSRNP